jgi:hypothetical protein
MGGNEVIYVSESNEKLAKKYLEIINYFGFFNFLKIIFYEAFFICKFYRRCNKIKSYKIKKDDLNSFLEEKIGSTKFKRIFSIGCPCFINPDLSKINNAILYNLHGGIIPFQKGKYSPLKSIKKKHKYLGATLHLINDKFDEGQIISQSYFEITSKNKLCNYNKVLKLSSKILDEFMKGKKLFLPKNIIFYFK